MLKNKSILSIIMFFCIGCFMLPSFAQETDEEVLEVFPPSAEEVDESIDNSINEAIQNTSKEIKTPHVEDLSEMTPNVDKEVRDKVLADTNNELTFTLNKFLSAMLYVLLSCVVIYFVLSLVKKADGFKIGLLNKAEDKNETIEQEENLDVQTLNNEADALKIFFDKTK